MTSTMTSRDLSIRADVLDELARDGGVDALGVFVAVHEGAVTLSGEVVDHAHRLAAVMAVRRVAGVRAVVNDLVVRPPVGELGDAESWALLARGGVGRLAVRGLDGDPDVFPLNFLVHERRLYIRSAPGTKLQDLTRHPVVAFEIDGDDGAAWWSVVVRGVAKRLAEDTEIVESGITRLASWNPTIKYNYVRITPTTVTGRRFVKGAERARAGD